ncbi:MAG: NADH-quinone oxidoreductase subunit F, partial [Microlunatus sp.]|nr:NADH-quinone oxidoreductase subunit F [Microlunatus sp.]
MTDLLTPVLSVNWGDERAWKLHNYERRGGYEGLRAALTMTPDEVVAE